MRIDNDDFHVVKKKGECYSPFLINYTSRNSPSTGPSPGLPPGDGGGC